MDLMVYTGGGSSLFLSLVPKFSEYNQCVLENKGRGSEERKER